MAGSVKKYGINIKIVPRKRYKKGLAVKKEDVYVFSMYFKENIGKL